MLTEDNEAKAWLKRKNAPDEVIRVVLERARCYNLYAAYEEKPEYWGRILFDQEGYWIYGGEALTIDKQEQLARVIILWNN
jgi:hypothetical protein